MFLQSSSSSTLMVRYVLLSLLLLSHTVLAQRRRLQWWCLNIFQECETKECDGGFLGLGIFENCEPEGPIEEAPVSNTTTNCNDGIFGMGIFDSDCNTTIEEPEEECNPGFLGFWSDCPKDYQACQNRTDGLLGGRPILGDCGVINEFVDGIFQDNDSDGDGETDSILINTELDNLTNPWTIFPPDSLLGQIFNPQPKEGEEDDGNVIDGLLNGIRSESVLLTTGFIDEWVDSANVTNTTCPNATEPECMDLLGWPGFWVCRTMYDPFTGVPLSKSLCISHDQFFEGNDNCGCCTDDGTVNGTAVCPEVCGCTCELLDGSEGVWIRSSLFNDELSLGDWCVTKTWARTNAERYQGITCIAEDSCPASTSSPTVSKAPVTSKPVLSPMAPPTRAPIIVSTASSLEEAAP